MNQYGTDRRTRLLILSLNGPTLRYETRYSITIYLRDHSTFVSNAFSIISRLYRRQDCIIK